MENESLDARAVALSAGTGPGPVDGSGRMFDAIAPRYDRLNRILSFGADGHWRRRTVRALELEPGDRVLDVATGTADLALEIARRQPAVEVVGIDPSTGMLELGRRKIAAARLERRVRLETGDGLDLPFADGAFDAACVAFGIRNYSDRDLGLREMSRVVRAGGRIAILELSEPRRGVVAPFARLYIRVLVPWIGSVLSRAPEYRYLQRSIEAFPGAEEFAGRMAEAGLEAVHVTPLTFGVVNLFTARVAAEGAVS